MNKIETESEWRDFTHEDFKAIFETGIGRIERARVIECAEVTIAPASHSMSRGKDKKWKLWEGRQYAGNN